jgi:hypothetical protein
MDSKSHHNPNHFIVGKDQTNYGKNGENPVVNVNLELVGVRKRR